MVTIPDSPVGELRLRDVREGRRPVACPTATFPGPHCGLFEATFQVAAFPSAAALFVGPASCMWQARAVRDRHAWPTGLPPAASAWLCLDQEDLVLGFDGALERAIRDVEAATRPDVLFLVTTCPPEITGVDVRSVVAAVQPDLHARLAVVPTNGFARLNQREGMRSFLTSLVDLMEPAPVVPGRVSVLGARPLAPFGAELPGVLRSAGIEVRAAIPGSPLVPLSEAPTAERAIVTDEAADGLAEAMAARFGTPTHRFPAVYDPAAVRDAYAELAAVLGVDTTVAVGRLHAETVGHLDEARDRLAGVRFGLGAVDGSSFEAAAFLAGLGMVPLFVQADPTADDARHVDALLAAGHDPVVADPLDVRATAMLAARLRPKVFIGHAQAEMLAALGVAGCHLTSFWSEPGFAGTRRAVDNIVCALSGVAVPEVA